FNVKLYSQEKQIQILDLSGRLIKTITSNSSLIPVNISDLSNGVYFVKGISSKNIYTYKFIKL
ncbi:MAG: T9SS type A sorting domain-containing protein, partial [Bacteroidales bacterium]|nr:T9SS type A sorting domain-containing protein [Bacteroidales bacterium]